VESLNEFLIQAVKETHLERDVERPIESRLEIPVGRPVEKTDE
jgi:hypothetical protein